MGDHDAPRRGNQATRYREIGTKDKKAFKGKLTADVAECVAGHKVTVFKKKKGDDKQVGADKTNANGKYEVEDKGKSGTYYSEVKSAEIAGVSSCLEAKSGKVGLK